MKTLVSNNVRAWRIRHYLRRRGYRVYTHRQWGAVHRDIYAWRRKFKPVTADPADTVVQHITVTLDHGELKGDFFEDVRTIERIGFERFGSGISYNFVVDMTTGEIAVGMPLDAKGTHTVNDLNYRPDQFSYDQNAVARGIAVLGMPDTKLSLEAEAALIKLLTALVKFKAITPDFDYLPHSVFAAKGCPSDNTRNRMGFIRQWVNP